MQHTGCIAPSQFMHSFTPAALLWCDRYADVLVHRVLAATLDLAPLPLSIRDAAGLRAVVDNLNTRHRNAQMAGRASVELHTLIFFNERTALADARITKVRFICRREALCCLACVASSCLTQLLASSWFPLLLEG